MSNSRLGWIVAILVAFELFMGVGGALSGAMLVIDPVMGLGMSTDILEGSPFRNFLIPGAILFLAVGLLPLAVALGALAGRPWSTLGHVLFGVAVLGWIIVEWLMLGYISVLQPFILGYGIVVLLLALVNLLREGGRRRQPQRAPG